jgi:hypothetical protein
MRVLASVLALVTVCGGAVGCGGAGGTAPAPTPAGQVELAARPTRPPARPTPGGPVEVGARGSWFDPPVAVGRLPAGVWYCDRGTAHFASQTQGKGACPRCGGPLKQKGAASPAS